MGDLELPNRVVMAALTRMRCDKKTHIANDLMAQYYSARASAGLILSECSAIRPDGDSFPGCAWIQNEEHVKGWKKVNDAIHQKGGRIFIQIWHGGRAVHPDHIGGLQTIAPSAIPIKNVIFTKNGKVPHATPRAVTLEEISQLIKDFRNGAENAKKAGFDGIQLHGAHGYLVDEFLRTGANKRTDKYGGSIENRARFCLEILDQLIDVFGPQRTGIKLSPIADNNDMSDEDPIALMDYLIDEFNRRKLGFVEVNEAPTFDFPTVESKWNAFYQDKPFKSLREKFRPKFKGTWIANFRFTKESANEAIEKNECDLVSFGNLYCQNDNLVEKFQKGITPTGNQIDNYRINLAQYYYGEGPVGYTDLSVYEQLGERQKL